MALPEHPARRLRRIAAGAALALAALLALPAAGLGETSDLFAPIAKVLQSPRCVNCHPRGDNPLNGDEGRPHRMKITRGIDGLGADGARCYACHRDENSKTTIVPGAPHWSLAPASMTWQGLSEKEVCAVLKDPKLNGNRSLADLVTHMNTDQLVLWGWNPGKGRAPVPIPHDEFIRLLKVWVDAGGPCPA
ncbi:hypothetical protein [Labrys wisconsinensis]|uniref:Cytochrome c553 n=1 Tax=Labrys wisconsinensis TaxID=425677 RepID=A0ABU0JFR3_9HYPH|nr:hypothetical protein [Labrys wisconsinensis]MDQ0472321.1 cytochrome c553 [Labrys wisconsinensis]